MGTMDELLEAAEKRLIEHGAADLVERCVQELTRDLYLKVRRHMQEQISTITKTPKFKKRLRELAEEKARLAAKRLTVNFTIGQ